MMNKRIMFSIVLLAAITTGSHAQKMWLHSDTPGVEWTVLPQDEIGPNLPTFDAQGRTTTPGVKAIVPGTTFSAYVAAGKEQDPNFGDNIYQVDRTKYNRTFWYCTSFRIPDNFDKELVWLNLNGVNRKAEIYVNGTAMGQLDGFMHRGRYNITTIAKRNRINTLAIKVEIPRTPLANQGSPNYLSSGGWDWMPYVPGLNSGITDKIWLENTGAVTLQDPWVRSQLVSNAKANLSLRTQVANHTKKEATTTVKAVINPGNITVEKTVTLHPGEEQAIAFDKVSYPQLVLNMPRLWWPNGMGEPYLYTCTVQAVTNGQASQEQTIRFGVRKFEVEKTNGVFKLLVNGMPVFVKGADWGMSEYMLRLHGKQYETLVRFNKEMNFNMIRNWLGSVTDEEFYDYCDEYGLMVWDDFWINSNPNLPYDLNAFNLNMIEKIKRLRNHACIAVWCGDNEGTPEPPLTGWMAENIRTFDGGDRYFQPCSNNGGLTGSGPWGANDQRWYFTAYPDCKSGSGFSRGWGMRTEIGTSAVPNYESLICFMPKEHLWPVDDMWNKHFFGPSAFNATPERHTRVIQESYGGAKDAEEFCTKSQWINLESNKAIYEGWLDRMWDDATGAMLWMSGASYPCMVWQTYDYYGDLTGAYFGCRQACEPIHIYWNPVTDEIKVANTSGKNAEGLTARAEVYNADGKLVERYTEQTQVNSPGNTSAACFTLKFNKEREIISRGCKAVASSTNQGNPDFVTDCNEETRWAAIRADNEWIYVDLGSPKAIGAIRLNWEAAYGKAYKIQVSDDAHSWREVYKTEEGHEGIDEILLPEEVTARYVRMLGIELGWWYGYSLWSMDVLGPEEVSEGLTDVHFIKLSLTDKQGRTVSQNSYWRGNNRTDLTGLTRLKAATLKVKSTQKREHGKVLLNAQVSLPKNAGTMAFGIRVQPLRSSDNSRILPALISDNYFTLAPGEVKDVAIEFDESLIADTSCKLKIEPYNN